MGDFDAAFVRTLEIQSWSLYSVGMFLILLRIYARLHRLGLKGLQIDDYGMILAGCCYTILIVCLNVICQGGGSNLYPPEDFDTFTQENIEERIQGSKIVVVSEQAMLNLIYIIKACMLVMYTRLTLALPTRRLVIYLSIYVFVGWVSTEIAFFTACRPFYGYWAMPPPTPQCTTLEHYAIVQGAFNISSDLLMLCIPLPLFYKLNVPWRQKGVLVVIFGMGTFVIIAALCTKIFNLTDMWDPSYMLWYIRESSVAVYVSNLPMIWPLVREYFPVLKRFTPGQKSSSKEGGRSYGTGSSSKIPIKGKAIRIVDGPSTPSDKDFKASVTTTIHGKIVSEPSLSDYEGSSRDGDLEMANMGESSEKVENWDQLHISGQADGGGIHMSTTVQISEEHIGRTAVLVSEKQKPTGGLGRGESGVFANAERDPKKFTWNFPKGK
ncbi:hypothetical protein BJ875DRAFT_71802 [Amylocarpus encephaloides]|uniref:Rhodopsin domain-containing protein n=1 Tax=Amylocarpus encephaloides TaxID=45428 RepID=A0A9P7YFJ2_9HELO|nr:hypothetical protein BJ875DRAFT_71802 [Amylocarpus encephaloides]